MWFVVADLKATCGIPQPGASGRIVAGQDAVLNLFPWQAALERNDLNWELICGAVIIDNYWALTAGHCVEDQLYVDLCNFCRYMAYVA